MPFSSCPISNDLLLDLVLKRPQETMNYSVIAQSADEVRDVDNSPSASMGPYLIHSEQARLSVHTPGAREKYTFKNHAAN